jgi:hypothetical protein
LFPVYRVELNAELAALKDGLSPAIAGHAAHAFTFAVENAAGTILESVRRSAFFCRSVRTLYAGAAETGLIPGAD